MNVTVWLPALHMGSLHPFEQALTVALAFGPFLVLGAVIVVRRRHDAAEDAAEDAEAGADPADATQRDR